MIKRYRKSEITSIWGVDGEGSFTNWLEVELAILDAKADLGMIPMDAATTIRRVSTFCVERIEEIEAIRKHDMLAFVENVQESIPDEYKRYFHEDITSYDTEEPATSLMVLRSMDVVFQKLQRLLRALAKNAIEHKFLYKIHRTHGQQAQPITFGLEELWWYDSFNRQQPYMRLAHEGMQYTKISGAVGTYYPRLSPQLEKVALEKLGLKSAAISAQINLRDRLAHVMNCLAVLMSIIEHVAENLRLYGQSEIREVQEPFSKGQKGSSAMPHKRNTIGGENLCGQARNARHFASGIMEAIPTWGARDIDHSSTERVFVPDMFHTVAYSLDRLSGQIEGMVVNEKQMERNLNLFKGVIFSPEVKELLLVRGAHPEVAYEVAQSAAFEAVQKDCHYIDTLLAHPDFPKDIRREDLEPIFNPANTVQFIEETFQRTLNLKHVA